VKEKENKAVIVGDAAQVESLICGPFPSGVSSIPGGV
jgi:hypothetical protein